MDKYNLNFRLENIFFKRCDFREIPSVIHVNRETLPENYSRYTFLSIWRLFKDYFWVAIDDTIDDIIGYIMNKIDKGRPLLCEDEHYIKKGHIFSLGVLAKYRRRGIASALFAISTKKMIDDGIKEVFLEVRVSNMPAITLYKGFKMKIVGEIPNYYADGENAYIMAAKKSDLIDKVTNIFEFLQNNHKIK